MSGMRTGRVTACVMAWALVGIVTIGLRGQQPDRSDEALRAATQSRAQHRPEVPGTKGLVTAGHPIASMTGMRILLNGGNAFDAAFAVHATLNLVEPSSSGLGGNGFMTLYDKKSGKFYSLAATGQAPKALKPEHMNAETLNAGVKASLIPGLMGGWITLLDRFGTKSLAEVLAPAIEYAETGYPLDPSIARGIANRREEFEKFPNTARIFVPGGQSPRPWQMWRNPDLANTLKKVVEAEQNALKAGKTRSEALQAAYDRFYKGDIAQDMAAFFRENGGLITMEDLAAYQPKLTEPLHSTYRGYDIYTSPSTSRGGFEVLMQLNIIEGFDLKALGHNSAATLHLIAESIKLAKADVYKYVADPAFTKMPVEAMLSKEYAASRRTLIDMDKAMVYPEAGMLGEATSTQPNAANLPKMDERSVGGGTTSFSIADQFGNVISVTPTNGGGFGSGMLIGTSGLFFNNGMRIGSTSPYPDNVNYPAPGKIPLLNNSPLLVFKDGKPFLAFGSPGGETIGQTEFQTAINVIDFGMSPQQAVEAARFALDADPNFYRPGSAVTMNLESRVSPAVVKELQAKGHNVRLTSGWNAGSMQAIMFEPQTGTMIAAGDPRRLLYAIGW